LLAGRGRLDENFTLTSLGTQGDLNWVQLVPKNKDGGYESIRIGFAQGKIRTLEMVDGFGNTTRVTLESLKENPQIGSSTFQFTPPKGVDVISE
jgi:outer membrane lipoprotein carrier protein